MAISANSNPQQPTKKEQGVAEEGNVPLVDVNPEMWATVQCPHTAASKIVSIVEVVYELLVNVGWGVVAAVRLDSQVRGFKTFACHQIK